MKIVPKRKISSVTEYKQLLKQVSSEIDNSITIWAYGHNISEATHLPIYFHNGLVDGGTIGSMSEALDHLDKTLDGGTF